MALLDSPETSQKALVAVKVLTDRCAGCQECVIRCPTGALSLDPNRWLAVADDNLCVGCRQCVRACPFSAITVQGPVLVAPRTITAPHRPEQLVGDTTETRKGLVSFQAAVSEAERCIQCPDPTCVRGCPAHNDIPGFIAAIKDRNLVGAHAVLRRTTVLPDVCSRVCDQAAQCEGACTWSLAGDMPVAIGALERFVSDRSPVPPLERTSTSGTGMSVGIVGSGPAGIGAAWELLACGTEVTVYERDAEPGGLLRWGIPPFTLPEEVSRRAWRQLTAAGTLLRCGTEVRAEDLELRLAQHDAVLLANGATLALRLAVPGADLAGVEDSTTFLTRAKHGLDNRLGLGELGATERDGPGSAPEVLVIGAGNTAMDVARSALRLGACRATCVDWMDRRFAPVRPDELEEATAEGVEVRFLTTLVRLEGAQGRVKRAYLARTIQRHPDELPRFAKEPAVGETFDLVVMAMGYQADPSLALPGTPVDRRQSGIADRRWLASGVLAADAADFAGGRPVGTLAMEREAGFQASALPFRERLWAAGDALVGPSTVVEAMAQGRRAARAMLWAQPRRP